MSLEALKIIILACQVSAGGAVVGGFDWVWMKVDRYQAECQKKLIKCDAEMSAHQADEGIRIRNCLLKRGE